MNVRRIAVSAGAAVVLLAAIALVARPLARHFAGLSGDIATTAQQLTIEPESVEDAAVQKRFHRRRAAVAAMREDLLKVVTAESSFLADSGGFTNALPRAYWPELSPANVLGAIWLTPHGWWTTIINQTVSIFCAVVIGPDTTIGNAPPGQPVCLGEHAQFPRGLPAIT